MKSHIESRTLEFARILIAKRCTVRDIAEITNVSKSTVHKDLNDRLIQLDLNLWQKVRQILETNLEERNIRGGEATKQKWKNN